MKELKLITALGTYKDLVLELIDFFNDAERRYKPEAASVRAKFRGNKITELHLICTRDVLPLFEEDLRPQLAAEYPALTVRAITLPCADIACSLDDETMRSMIYEAVKDLAADGLIISSGGRKTLTNRLIEAGLLYGCMGYLSITAPKGQERREASEHFNVLWFATREFANDRRQGIIKDEQDGKDLGDNFRSLYLLPLMMIERLRREKIGADPAQSEPDLAWLLSLPKADLHCHLGGAYDTQLLKTMAASLLDELAVTPQRRERIRRHMEQRAGIALSALTPDILRRLGVPGRHCLNNVQALKDGLDEPWYVCAAVLVDGLSNDQIETISRDGRQPNDWRKDLDWYMACGDLAGSTLLQTKGALRLNLSWLMEQSYQENVRFLEVRFSPDNYTKGGLTIPQVISTLLDEAQQFMGEHQGFHANFLIMATRHKDRASMEAHVAAAVIFRQSAQSAGARGPSLTGFDLAGQEEGNDPSRFQDIFMPLHHHFINITIHAGEMAKDDKIWQAIYLLHARRIGHGLKLINNRRMMNYIRDYAIAIEMCPSSNRQTNHFRHFDIDEQGESYPLRNYLDHGIAVTINTDNRGISGTTMTNEYRQAARLTKGGLSRWDILRLVKNGFKAAFLPKDEKDRLLKEVDQQVFDLVLNDFFPEGR